MTPAPQKKYFITERDLRDLIAARYMENVDGDEAGDDEIHNLIAPVLKRVRTSHTSPISAEQVLVQCETCLLEGTRACMYHGYPDTVIPKSCRYKVGVDADEALKNLEGTFIIKNLRSQRGREL